MTNNITWHTGKVSPEDRFKLLDQRGCVVWFTGLSASGKSTIAVECEKRLWELKNVCYRLDGDNIRSGLNSDLSFTELDRNENIRRISEVAKLFKDAGLITLVAFISPFRKMRQYAKNIIGQENFLEVYVKCSLEKCMERDPKGLYAKAEKGIIKNFTGISSAYEEPNNPDIICDTENMSISESVNIVIDKIKEKINV
jgi:adenylyl-sulfate kinase